MAASAPRWALVSFLLATHLDAARDEEDYDVVQDAMSVDSEYFPQKGVTCYCKAVESMSHQIDGRLGWAWDCDDNKYREKPENPGGPRFFHSDASKKDKYPHLCCKLDWTPRVFSSAAHGYEKQDDLTLCMSESRAVPSDSCCRLESRNDARGMPVASVGLSISRAKSIMQRYDSQTLFYKKPPTIDLDDITGGKDYNGEEVPLQDVKEFVQAQLKRNRFWDKLECGGRRGSFDDLFNEKGECQLRTGESQQCCCQKASLIEAERCLPAEGAPDHLGAQQQVLESVYEVEELHGKKEGKLTDDSGPDFEPDMQATIKGVVDPSMKDLPETEATETEMVWDWVKAPSQWKKTCVGTMRVPYVISKSKRERVEESLSRRPGTVIPEKYKTSTEYTQGYHEEICAKWQWDRTCGAGQGLFIKQINPGQCMKEKELTNIGALSFKCPQDYSSGNPKCKCSGDCK